MKKIIKNWFEIMFLEGSQSRFNIKRYTRQFKLLKQRLVQGWDDSEVWNLEYTISKFTLPRLKRLKEIQNIHPSNITEEEWSDCVDKMILAFELNIKDFEDGINVEERKKMEDGLLIFAQYYQSLWD